MPRLLNSLLNGEIDFKYPDNKNWRQDRKQGFAIAYSAPIDTYTDGVLVLPEHKGRGLAQFHRLGIIRGFTPWALRGAIAKGQVTLVENSTMLGMLSQVQLGRSDGAYLNINVARHILTLAPPDQAKLVFDDSLPYDRDSYALSTLKHPELIAELSRYLEREKDSVAQIRARFLAKLERD